jgi:transcription-repair coupling factor (superfamily II helicase)
MSSRPVVTLDLPLTAHLPNAYIPDLNLRLAVYQRLSQAADDAEAAAIENELRDRFGELPAAARNLFWVLRLRLLAMQAGVGAIQSEGDDLVIRLLPGLSFNREAVARRAPLHTTVLSHQLRMNRDLIGEGWREALVRALAAITLASAAPTVS